MSVQSANLIDGSAGSESEGNPLSVATTLGTVGYAAFALLQPIPLGEIVPFPSVVAAFEAEAAGILAVPAAPEPPEPPVVRLEAASEVLALVKTPEPVVYTEGGYRPKTYTEGGYHPVPFEPTLPGQDVSPSGPDGPVEVGRSNQPAFAVSVTADTDDTVLREVVELTATSPTIEVIAPVPEPDVEPDEGVPALARAKSFAVGGYAADGASDDSRARQVLDELSFLFNEG